MSNYGLCRIIDKKVILTNLMKWRKEQKEILRNPQDLTWDDQEKYWRMILDEECKRFSNTLWMKPLTLDSEMIGWCGLTHIEWSEGRAIKAEPSFIVATQRAHNPGIYEADLTYFLGEITKLFFNNQYWKGHKLYAEGYDIPSRQHHFAILEKHGFKREGVLRKHTERNGIFVDSILFGMLREDYEFSAV